MENFTINLLINSLVQMIELHNSIGMVEFFYDLNDYILAYCSNDSLYMDILKMIDNEYHDILFA